MNSAHVRKDEMEHRKAGGPAYRHIPFDVLAGQLHLHCADWLSITGPTSNLISRIAQQQDSI